VTNHYKWINNEILPSTGGYGAAPWQLVGLALMLTPLVFHYSVKRKQKGGAK
jgi:LPXTG-motif cell wall-anchored protein